MRLPEPVISKKRGGRRNLASPRWRQGWLMGKDLFNCHPAESLVERYLTDLKPLYISSKNR